MQLHHPQLQKFLGRSSRHISETERENLRVEMHSTGSTLCYWRIMPRYKVKSTGDHICANDEILFEVVGSQGRPKAEYLNSCNATLTSVAVQTLNTRSYIFTSSNTSAHEVNVAGDKSAFIAQVFSRSKAYQPRPIIAGSLALPDVRNAHADSSLPETDFVAIRAGDMIQLFHQDLDAYLCLPRQPPHSTASDAPAPVLPYLRAGKPRITKFSATNFFVVEKLDMMRVRPLFLVCTPH